jgi:hypothetical protein
MSQELLSKLGPGLANGDGPKVTRPGTPIEYFIQSLQGDFDIEECLIDRECAGVAAPVILKYLKYSNYPEAEFLETVHDCNASISSMRTCVGFAAFAREDWLRSRLHEILRTAPDSCRKRIEEAQVRWERLVAKKCSTHAYAETGGGRDEGLYFLSCKMDALDGRVGALESVHVCSPCSACLLADP